jgi:hypothetical protein
VFNEDPEIKRLIAASDGLVRGSRKAIDELTMAGELLSTMIEASNNMAKAHSGQSSQVVFYVYRVGGPIREIAIFAPGYG